MALLSRLMELKNLRPDLRKFDQLRPITIEMALPACFWKCFNRIW